MTITIAGAAARGLLARRRTLLMFLLAAVPVVVGLVVRDRGPNPTETAAELIDFLVIRAVLPITALVLGTAVLGSELEDGTAIFLLTSPVARWRIVAAKLVVAGGGSALIAGGSALLAGLAVAVDDPSRGLVAGTVLGVIVGAVVYSALFLAASIVTSRALILGLIYTLVWEGTLASLFAGTRLFSVRQYVLAIADALGGGPTHPFGDTLDATTAIVVAGVILGLALAVAVDRLRSWESGPAD